MKTEDKPNRRTWFKISLGAVSFGIAGKLFAREPAKAESRPVPFEKRAGLKDKRLFEI